MRVIQKSVGFDPVQGEPRCFDALVSEQTFRTLMVHLAFCVGVQDLPPSWTSKNTIGSPAPGLGTGILLVAILNSLEVGRRSEVMS
jgi:hypothetical protein